MNNVYFRARPCFPLALLLAGAVSQAQPLPEDPRGLPDVHVAQMGGEVHIWTRDDNASFAGVELGQERLVKAAPYCADAVHETVQPLADGNRIVRSQSSRLCRDGEGRTRQEVTRGNRRIVYLRDPVARESWMLDLEAKTARSLGSPSAGSATVDQAAWRDYSQRVREWASKVSDNVRINIHRKDVDPAMPTPPAPPVPPAPPAPVVITQPGGGDGSRLQVVRIEAPGAVPAMPPMPGLLMPQPPQPPQPPVPPAPVAMRALTFAPRGAGVLAPLGSKEIDGLKASGERTTWTIEAGKVGNEKPILITREVWTSPDLMLTLQSRDFDPRSGETNYRLQNLKRGEPDAALMRVPADFTSSRPTPPKVRNPRASEPTAKG